MTERGVVRVVLGLLKCEGFWIMTRESLEQ
jgi:hypothetical protein